MASEMSCGKDWINREYSYIWAALNEGDYIQVNC